MRITIFALLTVLLSFLLDGAFSQNATSTEVKKGNNGSSVGTLHPNYLKALLNYKKMKDVRMLQRILKSGSGKFGKLDKIAGKYNNVETVNSRRHGTDLGQIIKPLIPETSSNQVKSGSLFSRQVKKAPGFQKNAFKIARSPEAAHPKSRSKRQAIVILQLAPDAVGAPIFDAFRGDDIGPYDDALYDNNLLSIFPALPNDSGSSATTAIPVVAAPP